MRDINDYAIKYSAQGFEKYKVLYRRKNLLEIIEKYQPKNILEIGCGYEPLFLYLRNTDFTIVEPAGEFYNHAKELIGERKGINLIQGFFEEVAPSLASQYDMIVCAGLLHEVELPQKLVNAIVPICNENTIVYIEVPNANSMHRLLGKEMGILADVHDFSQRNIEYQQNSVFDSNSLKAIVTECGLETVESGSLFIKPFSHAQMYEMLAAGIINEDVLDGLYELGKVMPEFGSEIYVNCKLSGGNK